MWGYGNSVWAGRHECVWAGESVGEFEGKGVGVFGYFVVKDRLN